VTYERLAEEAERPAQKVRDLTSRWEKLRPVGSVNGVQRERLEAFCASKRITLAGLEALGTRIAVRRGGGVWLAFAGTNGAGRVVALKYRLLGGNSDDCEQEPGSVWLRPIVVGNRDSRYWIPAEGETEAARLFELVGEEAAILCLPAGALTFKAEWAAMIPRGATVYLAHDADEAGDQGAEKAAQVLGGSTVRLRPPEPAKDWCDWPGDREQFVELVHQAKAQPGEPHSWTPIDLVATANEPPEPATIGGIAYPGRRHVYSGEPETLKSWAALVLCVEEIRAGRTVLYIDFNEMGGRDVLERLRALGLTDEEIRERFIYLEPHEAMTDPAVLADVAALVRDRNPSLVVLDAFTGALETHRLDPASGVEVQRFYSTVIDPLRAGGAGVLALDHLKKDPTSRGKFSIGSERKIGACDVHLGFEAVKPFGRGRSGLARIVVHKDRPGYLARPKCAELALTSDPETGCVTWTLTPSEPAPADERPFRPTFLMERVSRHVEHAGEVQGRNALQRAVKGNAGALRQAIELLVAEKHLAESEGPRNAKPLTSLRPYREADET